jgi:hypothetical protein
MCKIPIRIFTSAAAIYAASTVASVGQEIGLVSGSFEATYVQTPKDAHLFW